MRPPHFAPAWLTARPIAHRGLHTWQNGVVENTLGAFGAAIDGNYAIECDLQISRDGEAMIFHDDTLDRVTTGSGPVSSQTVSELKRVNFRHSAERIPTLAELLTLTAGKVPLVIELKAQWNGDFRLAARSVQVLKAYSGEHALMSFDPAVVAEVRRLSPATIRGFISDRGFDPYYNRLPVSMRQSLRTLACLEPAAPHFISMDIDELPWAPIEILRTLGTPVITWTIRSVEQAVLALRYSDQITFEGFSA